MQRRIHIDLDNVVADFEAHYFALTGVRWADVPEAATRWALLAGKEKHFFLDMPVCPGGVEFVQEVTALGQANGLEVRFLTAVPRLMRFPDAEPEKLQWVREKLGSDLEVAYGPFAQDKQKHCQPRDILIDDNHLNIEQWHAAGGFGILHKNDLPESLCQLRNLLLATHPLPLFLVRQ